MYVGNMVGEKTVTQLGLSNHNINRGWVGSDGFAEQKIPNVLGFPGPFHYFLPSDTTLNGHRRP